MIEAETGAEALALLRAHPQVALLLTDLHLAGEVSGGELARAARQAAPRLPVIFMSGRPDSAPAMANAPGAAFVAKPYHPDAGLLAGASAHAGLAVPSWLCHDVRLSLRRYCASWEGRMVFSCTRPRWRAALAGLALLAVGGCAAYPDGYGTYGGYYSGYAGWGYPYLSRLRRRHALVGLGRLGMGRPGRGWGWRGGWAWNSGGWGGTTAGTTAGGAAGRRPASAGAAPRRLGLAAAAAAGAAEPRARAGTSERAALRRRHAPHACRVGGPARRAPASPPPRVLAPRR